MLQKLVSKAQFTDPDFVILDEPMSGFRSRWSILFSRTNKTDSISGKSYIFSSHLLNDAEKLCEDLVIIKGKGRIPGEYYRFTGKMHNEISITYSKRGIDYRGRHRYSPSSK